MLVTELSVTSIPDFNVMEKGRLSRSSEDTMSIPM